MSPDIEGTTGRSEEVFHVSVIVPVFNVERFVRQAVESAVVLPQVGEVILVDDDGPDNAIAVCRQLEGEYDKVRLLRHPDGRNHGAGASRNLGMENARYPFVAFLDADDWYLPNRFHLDEKVLMSDPDVDGVYHACGRHFETEDLRAKWRSQGRPELATVSEPVSPEELIMVLLWAHQRVSGEFNTNSITARRVFLWDRIGLFNTELRLQQDTQYWRRMAAGGRLVAGSLDRAVAVARVHPDNRMTVVEDHAQYMELWWSSLADSFRRLKVSKSVWQAYRRGYAAFRAERGPRWRAWLALGNWVLRQPENVFQAYDHFDLTAHRIGGANRMLQHALSFKNRFCRPWSHR